MRWAERIEEESKMVSQKEIDEAESDRLVEDGDTIIGVVPDEVRKLVALWWKHANQAERALNLSESYMENDLVQAEVYFEIGVQEKEVASAFSNQAANELRQRFGLWGKPVAVCKGWVIVLDPEREEDDSRYDNVSDTDSDNGDQKKPLMM